MNFTSMHEFHKEIVDCRKVQIEIEFVNASLAQLRELALFCLHESKVLLEDAFVLTRIFRDHKRKYRISEEKLAEKIEVAEGWFSFAMFGNTRTSPFNDSKKLKQYDKELEHAMLFDSSKFDRISADYMDYYHAMFDGVTDPEALRQQLLKLFSIEQKYYKALWLGEDVFINMSSLPYRHRKDLFFGRFQFEIGILCLGEHVVDFSNKAVDFLVRASTIMSGISGRVLLNPLEYVPVGNSPYMDYFSGHPRQYPAGRELYMEDHEWGKSCFLRGVEWFNLLSPLHTCYLDGRKWREDVSVTVLPNGGSTVTVKKDILNTQISDLKVMKRYLYPILFPGGINIPIIHLLNPSHKSIIVKPRMRWENVPIFAEELTADSTYLSVQHKLELSETVL